MSHLRLPKEQGGPVIPPGTGFPFVASYDSQVYGGGIVTHLQTGIDSNSITSSCLCPLTGAMTVNDFLVVVSFDAGGLRTKASF
jgi:hypothetical protein